MQKTSVAVLISGSGSNLQALIDAAQSPDYPATIAVVISNVPTAYGLTRAAQAGIPTCVIAHQDFASREAFDRALDEAIIAHGATFVCLAGFMRVLSAEFVKKWVRRMINIHPSLLPKYKGLHTHARALEAGDAEAGCTVHWVSPGVDEGDIIAQARVPIIPDDTQATLAARVLTQEHLLYPRTLKEILLVIHGEGG